MMRYQSCVTDETTESNRHFLAAAAEGDIPAMIAALVDGADPYAVDGEGRSALHLAKSKEAVAFLKGDALLLACRMAHERHLAGMVALNSGDAAIISKVYHRLSGH
jgi:ankyrin repeat protein